MAPLVEIVEICLYCFHLSSKETTALSDTFHEDLDFDVEILILRRVAPMADMLIDKYRSKLAESVKLEPVNMQLST